MDPVLPDDNPNSSIGMLEPGNVCKTSETSEGGTYLNMRRHTATMVKANNVPTLTCKTHDTFYKITPPAGATLIIIK